MRRAASPMGTEGATSVMAKTAKKTAKSAARARPPFEHSNGNNGKELAGKLPALVPQPHGGALYAGGVPGHVGAGGRPSSEVKARAAEILKGRIDVLDEIAAGGKRDADRLNAVELAAKLAGELGPDQSGAQPIVILIDL